MNHQSKFKTSGQMFWVIPTLTCYFISQFKKTSKKSFQLPKVFGFADATTCIFLCCWRQQSQDQKHAEDTAC